MDSTTAVIEPSHPIPSGTPSSGSPWGVSGSSPAWGSPANIPAPCSLEDVMSEELAKEFQAEEEKKALQDVTRQEGTYEDVDITQFLTKDDQDTTNDMLLAQMMQHDFDREHDARLQKEEAKYNANSKVSISFKNYRREHPALQGSDSDSSDEVLEDEEIKKDVIPQFKKSGISGKGKNIVTKHDAGICGTKNATKVMEQFPPDFASGDVKTRLPNHVYNQLKLHSNIDAKRGHRLHEKKEHATAVKAVDEKTRLIMYKLVNNEILEEVNGIISSGKESVVFHATGGSMTNALVPKECAIKVFKTTLTDFKNRSQYVKGDVRFFKDQFKKQNPRRIIKIWAQKEEFNLRRLEKFGIPVPRVVVLKKHVLVMEFIGEKQKPAPKLKDASLSVAEMQMAYEQCIENMKKMYVTGGIVHADLSEYNMLWHNDRLIFIDVSQAVEKLHPHAMEFLLRDCTNVSKFFDNAGIPGVPTPYQLFNDITGLNLEGEGNDFLSQIEEYEKNEETLRLEGSMTDYPFEFFFEKSMKEQKDKKEQEQESDDDDEEEEEEEEEEEAESSPSPRGNDNSSHLNKDCQSSEPGGELN